MKINVNEYNEILSYEGTPMELAEFVATGIFENCENYYVPDSVEEDCGCEEEEDVPYVTSYTEPVEPVDSTEESFDVNEFKDEICKQVEEEGIKVSDEEFNQAFDVVAELVNLVGNLR